MIELLHLRELKSHSFVVVLKNKTKGYLIVYIISLEFDLNNFNRIVRAMV